MPKTRGAKNIIHEKVIEEQPVIPQYINLRQEYQMCEECKSYFNKLKVLECPRCHNIHDASEILKKYANKNKEVKKRSKRED